MLERKSLREAVLNRENPCSNHEIRVLFEHGLNLSKPKLGPDLFGITLQENALQP